MQRSTDCQKNVDGNGQSRKIAILFKSLYTSSFYNRLGQFFRLLKANSRYPHNFANFYKMFCAITFFVGKSMTVKVYIFGKEITRRIYLWPQILP